MRGPRTAHVQQMPINRATTPLGLLPEIFHRQQRLGDLHHALIFVHRHFAQALSGLLFAHILMIHQHAFGVVDHLALLHGGL